MVARSSNTPVATLDKPNTTLSPRIVITESVPGTVLDVSID
jgi:hypothetical protein